MPAISEGRLQWRAGADRVAHAFRSARRGSRTLCGQALVDERLAHPALTKCGVCLAAADPA